MHTTGREKIPSKCSYGETDRQKLERVDVLLELFVNSIILVVWDERQTLGNSLVTSATSPIAGNLHYLTNNKKSEICRADPDVVLARQEDRVEKVQRVSVSILRPACALAPSAWSAFVPANSGQMT